MRALLAERFTSYFFTSWKRVRRKNVAQPSMATVLLPMYTSLPFFLKMAL